MGTEVLRYAAFTTDPAGGNPAGVVLDATGLTDAEMLSIAADVGYSETAFLVPAGGSGVYDVRYFSPKIEVPFCGHATVASAVALADAVGPGRFTYRTRAGEVPVEVTAEGATLVSVPPRVTEADDADVAEALAALGWRPGDLDPGLPPRVAYAGAHHLVLAAATRERLADLSYDFDRLARLMTARDWITVDLVWRAAPEEYHVRNPFPVGGVVEDPATGAAAAAFGGYLRALQQVTPPARLTLHQGHDMGRPSRLLVELRADDPRVRVTGRAVPMG